MFLSIIGMYEYDPSVFNGLQLPEGIDKERVISSICLECGELELLYPRLETMKLAITVWSLAQKRTWEKLYDSMYLEYNPIWNVDADEVETNARDIKRNHSGTNTETVSGFNSESWANAVKDDISNNENVDDDNKRVLRRTGNIGVTASQDLIKKEREVAEFSIIDYITKSFKERFCLMVY